ncbi:MAG: hypothetical protein O3A01_08770, partial [bacterium]|nr:hypothetical protein [bacterium]
ISDRIKNFILDTIPGRKIVLHGSYFPTSALKTMLIASRGKIRPTYNAAYECTLVQTDTDMRDNLKIKLGHSDEFTDIISQLLPLDIPQIYIESFQNLQQHALSYGSAPRAIFTANSLWWNDPFKLWSAKCLDTGTLLLGAQHGGNYGAVRCLPAEVQEVALCDRYYSWGWTNSLDNKTNTPIIPMPANKLMNNPQWTPKKGSKKKGLLLGTTFPHRHIIRLSNTSHTLSIQYQPTPVVTWP